jgi:hypothetical protein
VAAGTDPDRIHPRAAISQAVDRISFAGFSRVANSVTALRHAFTRSIGLLMAITVPACVLLATLARPLIHTIYGERWVPAAHALSLLAILGLMRVAYGLVNDCLVATPKRVTLMGVQALWLAALVPALLIGARLWTGSPGSASAMSPSPPCSSARPSCGQCPGRASLCALSSAPACGPSSAGR